MSPKVGDFAIRRFDAETENKINQIVSELHEKGIARWDGIYAAKETSEPAKDLLNDVFSRFDETFANLPDDATGSQDGDGSNPWYYERGTKLYVTETGRKRVRFPPPQNSEQSEKVKTIEPIFRDERIVEIVSRYFGIKARYKRSMGEIIDPAREGDYWHIDSVGDQVKAMILMSDVDMDNAPVRYKVGTHRLDHEDLRHMKFAFFKYGRGHNYADPKTFRETPGEIVYGTGKVGDCLFFDTLGLHSGTRCAKGRRMVIVVTYIVDTLRNNFNHYVGRRRY